MTTGLSEVTTVSPPLSDHRLLDETADGKMVEQPTAKAEIVNVTRTPM
ncbi:MAG: hypothetical protein KF861_02420 [Planctomycetaceae bacterium]|nr:hypothetical protein [Planctomycetaceae bacterium]